MGVEFGEFMFCPHDGSEVFSYREDPNFYFCDLGHHFIIEEGRLIELNSQETDERYHRTVAKEPKG